MPDEIVCFLLGESPFIRRYLRRYHSSSDPAARCPGTHGYHNAMFAMGDFEQPRATGEFERVAVEVPPDNPDWPMKCEACAYTFPACDPKQVFERRLYEDRRDGTLTTLDDAAPGAMWWAWWLGDKSIGSRYWKERGGGPHLMVKTPGGEWDVDMTSTNGEGWQWSGEPPLVSATPSIAIGNPMRYHGFLTGGVLRSV